MASEVDEPESPVDAMANLEPAPESSPWPDEHGGGTFCQEAVLRVLPTADVSCPQCGHSFLSRAAACHADGEPNCNREPSTMESWKTMNSG